MKAAKVRDTAYEKGELYPRPAALPPLLETDEYARRFLSTTRLPRWLARAVFALSGLRGFLATLRGDEQRFERLLSTTDIRLAPFSLLTLNATLLLAEDPALNAPLERAAALLVAARSFRKDLTAGALAPDSQRGLPLEMGQYANLFGTCLYPRGTCTRVFKTDAQDSITVAVNGHFYSLPLAHNGRELEFAELHAALCEIVRHARSRPLPGEFGVLSAGNLLERRSAMRAASRGAGRRELERLAHSSFVLCLDLDSEPEDADRAVAAIHRVADNRWHLSSMQLVVTGNARAALIASFPCGLDGNVMARFGSELVSRSQGLAGSDRLGTRPPRAQPFRLAAPRNVIERARTRVRLTLCEDSGVGTIRGLGSADFKAGQMSADAAFNIALLTASHRLLGVLPDALEHTSLSRYRNMGVEMARITTPELAAFVAFTANPQCDAREAERLLRAALAAHGERLRAARSHLSLKWLGMLNARHSSIWRRLPAWLLALSSAGRPDIIVSQPAAGPEVLRVGRPGVRVPYVKYFGLHYRIEPNEIRAILMPGADWKIPERVFFDALTASLHDVLRFANRHDASVQFLDIGGSGRKLRDVDAHGEEHAKRRAQARHGFDLEPASDLVEQLHDDREADPEAVSGAGANS